MAQVINTNIASIIAQNNLNQSQSALTTAIQRLSSGKRINSAADNAAGYAISQQFTAQINGLNQASQNANDGISFAQTADGALTSITNSLQTIRQLAVQSANASNSSSDRAALNQEVQQQINQINSVASQTQFNGLNILNGATGTLSFQVGANAGQTISTSGIDVRGQNLGAAVISGQAAISAATTATTYDPTKITSQAASGLWSSKYTLNGVSVDASKAKTLSDVINAFNGVSSQTGITVGQESSVNATLTVGAAASAASAGTQSFMLDGQKISFTQGASASGGASNIADAINNAGLGITATASGSTVSLSSASDITVYDGTATASAAVFDQTTSFGSSSNTGATFSAGLQFTGAYNKTLTLGAVSGIASLGLTSGASGYNSADTASGLTAQNVNVNSLSVSTVSGSNQVMNIISSVISQVSAKQATLGAIQNRFQATITNLNTASQNLTAARSRIQDTNFAQTTANLTRAQILQQAGTAMVAQANKLPNTVLQLLQ